MKIIKLRKKKLGDEFSLVSVKYKTFFGVKQRDAFYEEAPLETRFWYWCDNGEMIWSHEGARLLDLFFDSSEWEYEPNK